jgi:hypothetical protein
MWSRLIYGITAFSDFLELIFVDKRRPDATLPMQFGLISFGNVMLRL